MALLTATFNNDVESFTQTFTVNQQTAEQICKHANYRLDDAFFDALGDEIRAQGIGGDLFLDYDSVKLESA